MQFTARMAASDLRDFEILFKETKDNFSVTNLYHLFVTLNI